ncbi:MAG: hypothetical protein WKF77_29660 [Planctomycetaceae bacterium]
MKQFQHSKSTLNRRGSLITEGIIACIVLGVAISMLVPALAAVGRQRQAMRFDTLAMIELNNIAAAISQPDSQSADIKISKWFSDRYSEASLAIEPLPDPDDATKEIMEGLRLTIRRPQAESMPDQKVSVVVWRETGEPML